MKAATVADMDQAALLKRLQAGDKDAFAAWVSESQRGIYGYCLRMTGHPEDAQDLTQEVFVRAYRGIRAFRQQSQLSTWLYQIAHNACIDHLRRNNKAKVLSIQAQEEQPGPDMAVDTQPLPEQRVVLRENIAALKECLETLSRSHRAVTVLRHMQDMSYQEIAAVMKIPLGTVKSHICRARQHLKDCMADKGVPLGKEVG